MSEQRGPSRPHLVLTGASGLLALNWAFQMSDRFRVTLLQHRRPVRTPFATVVPAPFDDARALTDTITGLNPDIVVNCAAMTSVEHCEAEPDRAKAINATLAGTVARAANRCGARMVQISTDHLFDGQTPLASEVTPPCPVNAYARTKLEGEAAVLSEHPTALVVRTNFYGWGPVWKNSFSDSLLRGLRGGRRLDLFEDAWFTPILAEDLIDATHRLLEGGHGGVVNVVGPDRLSKLEFGLRLAKAFGLDTSSIRPARLSDRVDLVRRPLDMSLDSTRLVTLLGRAVRPLDQALSRLRRTENETPIRTLGPFMIPYGRHHIDAEDRAAVADFLAHDGWLTQGPTVERFEAEFAARVGAKYAVAVSSGTAGLHIAAAAAGLGPGTRALVPPVTFVATANAAAYCGAEVAFADLDPATANIDPGKVAEALASDPTIKAVFPVHFAGLPCDMAAISKVARDHGAAVIEDAAHALGASYPGGQPVGCCAYSDMTVFSFHPVKAIAMGEGGAVTTNDEGLYRDLLRLRSHGINKLDDSFEHPEEAGPWYYEMQDLGFNYRLTDLQCALGLSQLRKLDRFVDRRRALARRYDMAFADHPVIRPAQSVDTSRSGHHIYVVSIDFDRVGVTRTELMMRLRDEGIGTQVHYVPVPMHPYYRKRGASMDDLPVARAYYAHCLTIPLYYDLTEGEQDKVIDALETVFAPLPSN